MGRVRDDIEGWLNRIIRPRCPELEPIIVAAAEAYDAAEEGGELPPELLRPVVDAASDSHRPVYEFAVSLLRRLTGRFPEACQAVADMAGHPKSHVRFNAILSLGRGTPAPLALEILRQGLRDRSSRVRIKAADWSGTLRLREMVPDLERASANERDPKTKREIDFALALLRDGYLLRPADHDGFHVVAFFSGGINSRWVSRTELEQRGIEAIAAELGK